MRQPVKLRYIGRMKDIEKLLQIDGRLWDIDSEWHGYYKSSRSIEGLKELGIIQR